MPTSSNPSNEQEMRVGAKYPGAVIASLDGKLGLRTIDFQGIHSVPGRDAHGVYLTVELSPSQPLSRLAVLFSGLSKGADWAWYDLPAISETNRRLVYFAEAAIGEHLDQEGLPPFTPSGVEAFKIECFSSTLQSWEKRQRASDDAIFSYLEAKLFWSWRFEQPSAVFGHPDFLRTRASLEVFRRVALLGEASDWTRLGSADATLALEPTPEFLRRQRRRSSASIVGPAEALLTALSAPRYTGPHLHWSKALKYRIGETRDLENAAKEAVSAVEGLARVITGNRSATLGALAKELRQEARIDGAIAKTLEALWGYTNNAPGVRHGSATGSTLAEDDADFVLTSSEAALRYLLSIDR